MRVVKSSDVRIAELTVAAEELFLGKGYEQTSVSDITARAGVAKGLFYHYFRSKDEVLDAIAARYVSELTGLFTDIAETNELDAIAKVRRVFTTILDDFGIADGGIARLAALFDRGRHSAVHGRLATAFTAQVAAPLAAIVRQGVREGLFSTDHPEFVTRTLLTWGLSLHYAVELPLDPTVAPDTTGRAVEDLIERLLGAVPGSLGIAGPIEAAVGTLHAMLAQEA